MKNSPVLPYVSLFTFIQPDYHTRLVLRVLEYRKIAPPDVRGNLNASLNRMLVIPGFKNPAKAPNARLVTEISKRLVSSLGLLEVILEPWINLNANLQMVVNDYLQDPNHKFGDFLSIKGDLVELTPETQTAIKEIGTLVSGYEEDDILLMVCCLIDPARVPAVAQLEETAAVAPPLAKVGNSRLRAWLDELDLLDADAPEWDEIEEFAEAAVGLSRRKREARIESLELREAMAALIADYRDSLIFFGATNFENWLHHSPIPQPSATRTQIADLTTALRDFRQLNAEPSSSLAEAREKRAGLAALEDRILSLLSDLQATFADAKPEEATAAEQLEPQSPTAPLPTTVTSNFVVEDIAGGNGVESKSAESLLSPVQTFTPPETGTAHEDHQEEIASLPLQAFPQQQRQPPYSFSEEQSSQYIAGRILDIHDGTGTDASRDLIWRLLYEGRFGLAWRLNQTIDGEFCLPSWLLHAVILGPVVQYDDGEIATLLREDFVQFTDVIFVPYETEWNSTVRMLCAAAAMRPAVLAPSTMASRVLRALQVRPGFVNLHEIWQSLATFGEFLQPLERKALVGIKDKDTWDSEISRLSTEVQAWLRRAASMQAPFGRATRVWRTWQDNGQLLSKLLRPVLDNDAASLSELRNQTKRLSDESEIKREIELVDNPLQHRRPAQEIVASSFTYLRNHLRTALGFVRQWIDLQEARPGRTQSFTQRQAEILRNALQSRRDAAFDELSRMAQEHRSFITNIGITACRRALESVLTLFDPGSEVPVREPLAKYFLNGELLKATMLGLDDRWEPLGSVDEVTAALLTTIRDDRSDWRELFALRSSQRDHQATGWIIEFLENTENGSPLVTELSALRQEALAANRAELKQELESAKADIEAAVASDFLSDQDRLAFSATVGAIESSLELVLRFQPELEVLKALRAKIKHQRANKIEVVRKRLQTVCPDRETPTYSRIENLLHRGDIATANELLESVVEGKELPSGEPQTNSFRRFFPEVCNHLNEFLAPRDSSRRPRSAEIVEKIRAFANREVSSCPIGPLTFSRNVADDDQVSRAADMRAAKMLEAWFTAKDTQQMDRLGAKKILEGLGFNVSDNETSRNNGRTWIRLSAEPIIDRDICAISAFGSDAKGDYRILCVWDNPAVNNLSNWVAETSTRGAVLVFYFGAMSVQARLALAQRCRERKTTFIVIDDTVMLYLSHEPEPRLSSMFEITLPFTFAEPYSIAASLVPIEMFYGREHERRSIMDRLGSCFIFGGRQLGKTALLRDVERRFNTDKSRVALWFDLEEHGICKNRKIDDLWELLASDLRKLGIPSPTRQTNLESFLRSIEAWLEENKEARILLLLDEADRFLKYDGDPEPTDAATTGEFVRAARLKGAMDRTDRRFKVVFAGLHNVQRTTRAANHPLAHYGEPICIGPLLDNGEWREARNLIQRPLSTLGYDFENLEVVSKILWQTNYYPSLIQLYCTYLLRHVSSNGADVAPSPKSGPPYVISHQQVEDVYFNNDLRTAIRDRLIWTLRLDERYEVIAYAIALNSIAENARSTESGFSWLQPDGYTVSWIRGEALYWWADGFSGSDSEDAIRNLLNEMVGLGILRVVDENRYSFRSATVVSLLGTKDEIEATLLRSREVPLPYEPGTFRAAQRVTDGPNQLLTRSPLTAQQEADLRARVNGVSIIFGCRAAGLDDLQTRLRTVFGPAYFIDADDIVDRAGLSRLLSNLSNRPDYGTTMLFVPASCPWSGSWVIEAIQSLKKLKSARSFVRVVFIADPIVAWQMITDETLGLEDLKLRGVSIFELRPWHDNALRQWLDDCQLLSDQDLRQNICRVTGNWPSLLLRLFKRIRLETGSIETALSELEKDIQTDYGAFMNEWGLDNAEARAVFRYFITGDATTEDLALSLEDISSDTISQRLQWANYLGLVVPLSNDRYRMDTAVSLVLSALDE